MVVNILQGCESSDFNQISGFECIEKHIFSGISDYFRLLRLFLKHRRSYTPVYLCNLEILLANF